MASPQYFHNQNARPQGIAFFVVGIIGLVATWMFAENWFVRILMTVVFGAFVAFGGPAAFRGGCYRSWFADGFVYWTYPSRIYGSDDSCRVGDVVEFQCVIDVHSDRRYQLILRDGVIKPIRPDCFGLRYEEFYQALRKQNPNVRSVALQKTSTR